MKLERLTNPIDKPYYSDMEERLLDIENILGDDYDLDRLRKLAQADREGRCVVLPCRDGDSVYNTASFFSQLKEPAEHIVDGFSVWHGEITILCKGGSKFGVNKIGKTVFLTRAEAEAAIGGGRND